MPSTSARADMGWRRSRSWRARRTCTEKTIICRRRLAEQELDVGGYYLRAKSYVAALSRFETVYHDFSDLGYGDDALYNIGLCHLGLEDEEKAVEAWTELTERYPHSSYLKKVRKKMKKMGRS